MPFRALSISSVIRGAFIVVSCGTMLALAGCGGGGSKSDKPRAAASGKVEFDGKPVPAGTVSFINATTGNIVSCDIYNGSYSCSASDGPFLGDNAVNIVGMEKSDGNPLWGGAWTKQVKVDEKGFKEDFSIKSSEVKPFDPKSRPVDTP